MISMHKCHSYGVGNRIDTLKGIFQVTVMCKTLGLPLEIDHNLKDASTIFINLIILTKMSSGISSLPYSYPSKFNLVVGGNIDLTMV